MKFGHTIPFAAIFLFKIKMTWLQGMPGEKAGTYLTALSVLLLVLEYFRRLLSRQTPKETKNMDQGEKVRHAEELRKIFDEEIMRCRAEKLRKDAIIRHVSRKDEYPDVDDKGKGISPWFRVVLEETYHSGIHIGLRFGTLTLCPDGYRFTDYSSGEEGDIKVMLMGAIPYDVIETVNIEGDEYYSYPHIYCHFPFDTEPYERKFYAEVIEQPHGHPWYKEVADYESVALNSQNGAAKYSSNKGLQPIGYSVRCAPASGTG